MGAFSSAEPEVVDAGDAVVAFATALTFKVLTKGTDVIGPVMVMF